MPVVGFDEPSLGLDSLTLLLGSCLVIVICAEVDVGFRRKV